MFGGLLLGVVLLTNRARAKDLCEDVESHSFGLILCSQDDFGYSLKYHDWVSRRVALSSSRYDEMIDLLCQDGGLVRESWKKPFRGWRLRVIQCPEPNQSNVR